MKKLFLYAILFALLILMILVVVPVSQAQTFGGGTLVNGFSNVPCQNSSLVPITNTFFVTLPAKTVTVSGISATNENFSGMFFMSIPGYTNAVLGQTNFYFLGAFTNSFAAGTNSGSWSTNYPGGFVSFPFPLYMAAYTGAVTNTNTVYVP